MNPYAILAVVAVAIVAISEILISVQKSKMKKQFIDELDRLDGSNDGSQSSEIQSDDKRE